jgi:hypothetical protein
MMHPQHAAPCSGRPGAARGSSSAAAPAAAAVVAPPPPLPAAAAARLPRPHPRPSSRRRPLPDPPRITNARREVFADDEEDPVTSSTLPLPRDYAVFDPERGPLTAAGRVTRTLADELASEAISLEETAYWFAEPPLRLSRPPPGEEEGKEVGVVATEGGSQETSGWWRRGFSGPADAPATERAPELEGRFPRPRHDPGEDDGDEFDADDGPVARRPLSELREGEEVFGFVTDCWLYHGAQVDFLGEYDGLIPVAPDAWPQLQRRRGGSGGGGGGGGGGGFASGAPPSAGASGALPPALPPDAGLFPGLAVRARVHAVRREGLYRWPVQLELLEPASLAGRVLPRPGDWDAPVDLSWARREGWDFARIARETGRAEYVPAVVAMEPDMSEAARRAQRAYGRDDAQSAAWPAGDSPWHRALAQLGGYEAAGTAAAVGAAQRAAGEQQQQQQQGGSSSSSAAAAGPSQR